MTCETAAALGPQRTVKLRKHVKHPLLALIVELMRP